MFSYFSYFKKKKQPTFYTPLYFLPFFSAEKKYRSDLKKCRIIIKVIIFFLTLIIILNIIKNISYRTRFNQIGGKMKIPIKSRYTGNILFELDKEENSIKITLEAAIKANANLWNADLSDADLRNANLSDADLSDAKLDVKTPPVNDYFFISEILWRNAKTENQKDVAARIRMDSHICSSAWENNIALVKSKNEYEWAKEILCKWPEFKEKIKEYE
jgi:hypothetical protein